MPLDPTRDQMLLMAFFIGQFYRAMNRTHQADMLVLGYLLVTIAFEDPIYWLAATFLLGLTGLIQGLVNFV